MRITFVIPSLLGGGAERIASLLLNHWVAASDVTLVTYDNANNSSYALDERVRRVGLGRLHPSRGPLDAVARNLGRVRALRRLILASNPDAVVSFMDRTNVGVLLSLAGTRVPVVIAERNDPSVQKIGAGWRELRYVSYPRASAVVVQTESVRGWAREHFPNVPCLLIPNPVPFPAQGGDDAATRDLVVLGAGRLVEQKGFDLLLQAFALVASRHPSWRLVIHGEGADRSQLRTEAERLAVTRAVDFPGWTPNLSSTFRSASIFALSSRFEGFPNVLGEAMAHGLPVVSFACPSGPAELVRDGVDGFLVPPGNVDAFAARLDELMRSETLRTQFGSAARDVCTRFDAEGVFARWDRLLCAVARNGREGARQAAEGQVVR